MTDLITGDAGRAVVGLLVFAAVSLLFYAAIAFRRRADIGSALEPYTLEPAERTPEARRRNLAETTLSRRGVDLTARLLRPSKLSALVETSLEQADWSVRGAEALFFHVAAVAVCTLLGAAFGSAAVTVLAFVASALTPVVVLALAITRRRRRFESELPGALQMLAGSLRSGRSLLQALQGLVEETAEPVASELARALAHVRLGRPIEDALDEMARRVASEDARFVASAVRMQRPIGGNLAELLGIVAETMVERARLRGEVKALTAEGRMSAVVLGLLPIGLGLVMYAVDPNYMSTLFDDPLGRSMMAGAAALAVGGFFWMKKTMEVHV
ncbi:MAG TPA: type II secretion system F family protein [Acidimicrobiales bacterium]|nr:type II secretion system F family protein [Acidimicrobiales bacterium]